MGVAPDQDGRDGTHGVCPAHVEGDRLGVKRVLGRGGQGLRSPVHVTTDVGRNRDMHHWLFTFSGAERPGRVRLGA